MKNYFFACFFLLWLAGCDNESSECEDIACTSPAPSYAFDLVDKETSENLFTNGTLSHEDVRVVNENGVDVDFKFYSEGGMDIIIASLGWDTSVTDYTIFVGSELEIDVHLALERTTENCCTFFKETEFSISGYEYERDNGNSLITIFIDDESI